MEKKNAEDTFFNIIKFANNPELWKERKNIICKKLEKDFKRKEFIEKHLSENFKNLVPDKQCIDSLKNIIGYSFSQTNFRLRFDFTEREIFNENRFDIEVKLKDVESNCKVTNKKELREIFQKLLFRIGHEIGYTQGMIDRIDLDLKILRNEKESLVINESIQDIQKIFFDYVCNIVKKQNHLYNYLFPFFNYYLTNQLVKTQNEFFQFIADITSNKIDKKTIKMTFFSHRKKNKIS